MLKRFEVSNFRNFKEQIIIDFAKVGGYQFSTECITNENIGKMLIYGRNATGKTNLGRALTDITSILSGLRFFRNQAPLFLNADSAEKTAKFVYFFQFDINDVVYKYRKISEYQLYDEELLINGQRGFYYNFETKEEDFKNLKLLDADTVITERYIQSMNSNDNEEEEEIQTLPFLRWLINNTALQGDSVLLKLDDYIKRMSMMTVGGVEMYRPRRYFDLFYESLSVKDKLKDFEEFLNVMGVECSLELQELPDGQKELYFKHDRLVPFGETASSGTMTLMSLYRKLEMGKESSLMYIDEFDAFYHFEMSENVIKYLKKKFIDCQVIMTTHNTNLMANRLMRPDCLFILSRKGNLTALCDATPRELREGHNLEKLCLSGEFENYE